MSHVTYERRRGTETAARRAARLPLVLDCAADRFAEVVDDADMDRPRAK